MPDGKPGKNLQPLLRPLLIFHRATHNHIVPALAPVRGNAVHEPRNPFGQEQKRAVLPLLDHVPALRAPAVRFRQQEIRGKAEINQPGLHFVFSVFLSDDRRVKVIRFHDLVGIHPPFGIALVDIAEFAALAVPVTAPPGIPHCHIFPPLYQNPIAVVNFVLDDLRRPAAEGF